MNNEQKRHILKTISYRILSSFIGFLIIWFSTGDMKLGITIGIVEALYKPLQYYIHEVIWHKIK